MQSKGTSPLAAPGGSAEQQAGILGCCRERRWQVSCPTPPAPAAAAPPCWRRHLPACTLPSACRPAAATQNPEHSPACPNPTAVMSAECWAQLLPGSALATAAVLATAALLYFYVVSWREDGTQRSLAELCGMTAAVTAMHVVPGSGACVAAVAPWRESNPSDLAEALCLLTLCIFVPCLVQAALAGGLVLLVQGARLPGCTGGTAAFPAVAGIGAALLVIQLTCAILLFCYLGVSLLLEVGIPAAKAKAAAATMLVRRSVADDGAPSEAGSASSDEAVV